MHKLVAGMAAGLALAALATPGAASAERVTPKTKLTENGLGPIHVGMTLKQARKATGQKIKVVAHSQSSIVASLEMRGPDPTLHLDRGAHISYILLGNPNRPQGGLLSRFPGLALPKLRDTFGPKLHSAPSTILRDGIDFWITPTDPRLYLVYTFVDRDLSLIAGGVLPASKYPQVG